MTNNNDSEDKSRVLGFEVARELSEEEIKNISGGHAETWSFSGSAFSDDCSGDSMWL